MTKNTKPLILIVDDLVDMRMVLRITLERAGWDVVEAETSPQALTLAQRSQPDVILMDFNMPEMDGIQACRKIKNHPDTSNIPVVIYTGAYADAIRESAFEAGAVEFLTKPLLPAELRERLQNVYDAHQ